ncbi:Uncharacterized BCR, YitT family COG1284 [Fusobacterium necrogenes]|uniref:Uncharacterized BCR, YitT family COG1284 n=1 Tax=Fusobacterium necrogenes TaxID=858 RepID=A0A377GXW7_9FUSO|nr:hypothetical protein [Fusobacterium necrogenes]STO31775.1 Uncharacterized BCR, YitT family COG1284 [Fusobacterium necrogenes]
MKKEAIRYLKLFLGLFICALGCIIILKSNLGLAPWDVLHQGISKITGITIGQASINLGVIIVLIDIFLGQPIGIGTILNFIFIGFFMDLIIFMDFIPMFESWFFKVLELLIGIFLYSYGTYLYMIQGMGCGPRDGFMQILTKKFNKPISIVKNGIEIIAFLIGWLMGGKLGIGTIITALIMGIFLQWIFKFYGMDIKKLHHRNLKEEFLNLNRVMRGFED